MLLLCILVTVTDVCVCVCQSERLCCAGNPNTIWCKMRIQEILKTATNIQIILMLSSSLKYTALSKAVILFRGVTE